MLPLLRLLSSSLSLSLLPLSHGPASRERERLFGNGVGIDVGEREEKACAAARYKANEEREERTCIFLHAKKLPGFAPD